MRVVIITMCGISFNIGNRLQHYAAQEVLKRLGFLVDSVCFQEPVFGRKKKAKYLLQRLTGYRLPGDKDYWKAVPEMMALMALYEKFNKEHISVRRIKQIRQIGPADYYVVGSDQVWNPVWYDDCKIKKDIYLLTFAKPEQKVCLSPSFGIRELPEAWKPWFQQHLSTFPRIAVREDAGAKIIKELTGRDAVVTIDPTLMLDGMEWDKIAAKPACVDCKRDYILTYFLGGRTKNVESVLEKYSREMKADVYHLLDTSEPNLYVVGPSEFLYLVSRAKLVMTDSFHASVFSFLYGKPFLVYDRVDGSSMMSRMDTLFDKFDLRRKYACSGLNNDILECDYRNGYYVLARERRKLTTYLRESMGLTGGDEATE